MPDYFTKPIRSDRSGHEYGHTRLRQDDPQGPVWSAVEFAAMVAVVGLILWAVVV